MEPTKNTRPISRTDFNGNIIFQRRVELGLSLEAVAEPLNVGAATVSTWEKGERIPHMRFIPRLAKVLKVEPLYFFAQ